MEEADVEFFTKLYFDKEMSEKIISEWTIMPERRMNCFKGALTDDDKEWMKSSGISTTIYPKKNRISYCLKEKKKEVGR